METDGSVSYSSFVIIPMTEAKKNYCWILDRDDEREQKSGFWFKNLLKSPGGRVEPEETIEEAGKTEVSEEVGLRVKILETIAVIHKPSFIDPGKAHHDIFQISSPPLNGTTLKLGDEILDGGWKEKEEIIKEIKEGKFFRNHAAAFLWAFFREEYVTTGNESILAPILRFKQKDLVSWSKIYGLLTLCCNPRCKECRLEELEKPEPQKIIFDGEVKCALFYQTYFDDFILLEPFGRESYRLPQELFNNATSEEAEQKITNRFGYKVNYIGMYENGKGVIAVFSSEKESLLGLTTIWLNRPPEFSLPSGEWEDILMAGECYNSSIADSKKRMVINRCWIRKPYAKERRGDEGRNARSKKSYEL